MSVGVVSSQPPPGRPKGVAGNSQSIALRLRSRPALQSRPWAADRPRGGRLAWDRRKR
ncbi:hypothetical protein BO443_90279 [Burkholderia orbicola]